jgi:hypothetical protein
MGQVDDVVLKVERAGDCGNRPDRTIKPVLPFRIAAFIRCFSSIVRNRAFTELVFADD